VKSKTNGPDGGSKWCKFGDSYMGDNYRVMGKDKSRYESREVIILEGEASKAMVGWRIIGEFWGNTKW